MEFRIIFKYSKYIDTRTSSINAFIGMRYNYYEFWLFFGKFDTLSCLIKTSVSQENPENILKISP